MAPLLGMPQGAEWLVILAIVVLLFGSAKLPALVKQLGKSKMRSLRALLEELAATVEATEAADADHKRRRS